MGVLGTLGIYGGSWGYLASRVYSRTGKITIVKKLCMWNVDDLLRTLGKLVIPGVTGILGILGVTSKLVYTWG